MTFPPDDDLMHTLAELPARDMDPTRAERIRVRAHAALAREREYASAVWLVRARAVYRVAAPTTLVGVSASYLAWALYSVSQLFG